jgi:AraC-like DNA-binding protein
MEQERALRWSTDDVSHKDGFDYWRDSICAAFDPMSPELDAAARTTFRGTILARQFGDAALMQISASGHQTGRSLGDIASGSHDYVYLYRQRASAWFGFDNREGIVSQRGSLIFGDSDRPFRTGASAGENFDHLVLKIPRRLFEPMLQNARDIRTTEVSAESGIGALLSSYFDAFVREAPHLAASDGEAALQALASLTACAYGPLSAEHDPRLALRAARLQRAKVAIEAFLKQPNLSAHLLSQHLGLSKRALHRLFEGSGTSLSRYVSQRRVARARAVLADPANAHRAIFDIALDCGFDNLSTFYRLFGQAYSATPAEWRARTLAAPSPGDLARIGKQKGT